MTRTGSLRWWWVAVSFAAVVPVGAQSPSPFLSALDAIAQRQLRARADVIAGIKDTAAAEARKKAVCEKVLALIGGLPDYSGPLRARVTKNTPRDGLVIEKVMFDSPHVYVIS